MCYNAVIREIMKTYNKLVRDKIPEIIAGDNGKTCVTRIMEDDEYLETLNTLKGFMTFICKTT